MSSSATAFRYGGCSWRPHGSVSRIVESRAAPIAAAASVGVAVSAYERGATIIRAHDVREHVEALTAARAVVGA